MTTVDLRSDTVTRPDAAMRRAMAEAEVGDDVYGEDPTVRRLEEASAEALGHEAALFVPSGTMGNQIALHLHGRPGDEVVCEASSHVIAYEMGAMAALSGLQPRPVGTADGRLDPEVLAEALPAPVPYRSECRVLVLENTHNLAGGRILSVEATRRVLEVARSHGLSVHLDGARLFNAAVALGEEPARLAEGFDTVMFCLSKGLGAPVGSMLCGSRQAMAEAWRIRKRLGGGMRQVGILAAAGLLALRDGPARLADDHRRARRLAETITELPGLHLDPSTVETNIVVFRVTAEHPCRDAAGLVRALGDRGVRSAAFDRRRVRLVTHRDVDDDQVERALEILRDLSVGEPAPAPD